MLIESALGVFIFYFLFFIWVVVGNAYLNSTLQLKWCGINVQAITTTYYF